MNQIVVEAAPKHVKLDSINKTKYTPKQIHLCYMLKKWPIVSLKSSWYRFY